MHTPAGLESHVQDYTDPLMLSCEVPAKKLYAKGPLSELAGKGVKHVLV